MPEPSVASIAICQLRVVFCGVSTLVWRRLLVVGTTSIAELHEILHVVRTFANLPAIKSLAGAVRREQLQEHPWVQLQVSI